MLDAVLTHAFLRAGWCRITLLLTLPARRRGGYRMATVNFCGGLKRELAKSPRLVCLCSTGIARPLGRDRTEYRTPHSWA